MTETSVRTRVVRPFGDDFPATARVLFDWAHVNLPPTGHLAFTVPGMLPTSVNHIYVQVGKRRVLAPDAQAFRDMTALALGHRRMSWRPTTVMAMIFLCSPYWVNKKGVITDADLDNPLKCLLDAIEAATGLRDSGNWELHAYKVLGRKFQTTVYLFDLGGVVDFYA